jgi:hypothetical protein
MDQPSQKNLNHCPRYTHPSSFATLLLSSPIVSQKPMWLSPSDVLHRGLYCCTGSQFDRSSEAARTTQFRALYGSTPLDLAELWYDMIVTNIPGAKLTEEENTEKGFVMFLVAHYFLWVYPKNSRILAAQFGISEKSSRGAPMWKWVGKIAAMKEKKIVWNPRLDSPESEIFIITVDGTDFRVHEKMHPTLPIDRTQYSMKYHHGALKYEIGMAVFSPQCVWISGPHRGGKHDLAIFREGLKHKIAPGKRVIADRGYITSKADEKMLSPPDDMDSKALYNFKSRARLRHETFNGRLKNFQCLKETFRHDLEKHKMTFEAVCVIVQYQMDHGSEIYAV